jgi:hypothetical protein
MLRFISYLMILNFLLLVACSYNNKEDQSPLARKLSWFSYLASDDIRESCGKTVVNQFRFVYNAMYLEQVRTYDLEPIRGDLSRIKMKITQKAELSLLEIDTKKMDFLKPWRPIKSNTDIRKEDVELLTKSLESVNFFSPNESVTRLSSKDFYWLVTACVRGVFFQRAYLWPEYNFDDIGFISLLKSWDFSNIAYNPPRKTDLFNIYGTKDKEKYSNNFIVTLDKGTLLIGSP